MLSQLVGNVDPNAAFVLAALFVTTCVMITAAIVKRRSRRDIDHEFELAKMKQRDASAQNEKQQERNHEVNLANIASTREIEFKRIDENMITSHTRDVSPKAG